MNGCDVPAMQWFCFPLSFLFRYRWRFSSSTSLEWCVFVDRLRDRCMDFTSIYFLLEVFPEIFHLFAVSYWHICDSSSAVFPWQKEVFNSAVGVMGPVFAELHAGCDVYGSELGFRLFWNSERVSE